MSVSSVAKIGGAVLLSASVPTTVYFANDHIFLYQIERDVINGEDKLIVEDSTSGATEENSLKVELKVASSTKWSCLIKAKIVNASGVATIETGDKDKLKKYIEKRIPSTSTDSEPEISNDIKKANKKKLVWDCSGKRISVTDASIATELSIQLKKIDSKLTTTLFGEEAELQDN